MEIFVVCVTAFAASCLTFFSGFGLGTILMPVFALFFSLEMAIAMTAVVHFLNNLFKLALLWKNSRWDIVLKFGAPAFLFAFAGAKSLFGLETLDPIARYSFLGKETAVTPVKLAVACLIMVFVVLEMMPWFKRLSFSLKYLPLGGVISGFLGGLSGHQGVLRSAFLVKCNLTKESFIATGVVIACLVDFSRMTVYSGYLARFGIQEYWGLAAAAVVSAFAGAWLGNRLLKKTAMAAVERTVSIMLIVIALLLAAGLV